MGDISKGRAASLAIPAFWAVAAIFVFILSQRTPMTLAAGGESRDTYYFVAHQHYAISFAAMLALFGIVYFVLDVVPGVHYRRRLGYAHATLTLCGALLIFSPVIGLNMTAMPGRFADTEAAFTFWNTASLLGYGMTLVGLAIFVALLADAVLGHWSRNGRSLK